MPSPLVDRFLLDPTVVYLNHGSFGACLREVLEVQSELRARMELEPVRFFIRDLPDLLDEARAALARFIGSEPRDMVFVRNATSAVNAVVGSLVLAAGDELLTTDHAYGACKNTLAYHCTKSGARLVVAEVPFPIAGPEQVVEAVLAAVTPRTRLVLLDHVTSPTALVFPVQAVVAELEGRGVPVMIDGAHAPGMLPLAVHDLGASYYTGNLHKWVCAPKGAAFLHVRTDRQMGLVPAIVSHGYSSKRSCNPFHEQFDWCGTDDVTSWLSVPRALSAVPALIGGAWEQVRAHNHALALEARRILCVALGVASPAPDAMLGSMAALPLAAVGPTLQSALDLDPLQTLLFEEHHIEVPIFSWPRPGARCLRVSAQLYNAAEDYHVLARALASLGAA